MSEKQLAQGPSSLRDDILMAWPRTVQFTLASVLALTCLLLTIQHLFLADWSGRASLLHSESALTHRLDLNEADRAQLQLLPEVGAVLAERIDDYRRSRGGFRSVDELQYVPGIGPNKLRALRPWVYVAEQEAANIPAPAQPSRDLPTTLSPPPAGKTSIARGPKAVPATLVNLNRATEQELQQLPGIGPTLAGRIVEIRQRVPFQSIEDLRRVPGIGPKTLDKVRPFVTVEDVPRSPGRDV